MEWCEVQAQAQVQVQVQQRGGGVEHHVEQDMQFLDPTRPGHSPRLMEIHLVRYESSADDSVAG